MPFSGHKNRAAGGSVARAGGLGVVRIAASQKLGRELWEHPARILLSTRRNDPLVRRGAGNVRMNTDLMKCEQVPFHHGNYAYMEQISL
jgi:hypothetical protein